MRRGVSVHHFGPRRYPHMPRVTGSSPVSSTMKSKNPGGYTDPPGFVPVATVSQAEIATARERFPKSASLEPGPRLFKLRALSMRSSSPAS
jgi:hypothetical protein